METALVKAGFHQIGLTPVGSKPGKQYLKDPEGTIFTVYKDGSGIISGPNGTVASPSAEKSLEWLEQMPPAGQTLTDQQMVAIKTLAAAYNMGCTEHYISANSKAGHFLLIDDKATNKPIFTIRKLNNLYMMYQTSGAANAMEQQQICSLDHWGSFWAKVDETFKAYAESHAAIKSGETPSQTTVENKGIDTEDYYKIKQAVDAYGDRFRVSYIKGTPSQQSPYVVVIALNVPNVAAGPVFSIGALGNYYQFIDVNNKPQKSASSIQDVVKHVHSLMSTMVGKPVSITADELGQISELTKEKGFNYATPGGGFDDTYVYIKGNDEIVVSHNNFVNFTRKGVFGPITHKPAEHFIAWFSGAYDSSKIPQTGEQFAGNIMQMLDGGGFLHKDTGQVTHQTKIAAIKAFRDYIIAITGGNCALVKSKWVIENLGKFMEYVSQHGLPDMDNYSPNPEGLFTQAPEANAAGEESPTESDKFTKPEVQEVCKTISKYAPTLSISPNVSDSVVFKVVNITFYKVEKTDGVYRMYNDINNDWSEMKNFAKFDDLNDFLDDVCYWIVEMVKRSKMGNVKTASEPSKKADMLSASEVQQLKELIEAFGLTIGVNTTKKNITEAAGHKKDAYSCIISDPEHAVWFKVYKIEGYYQIDKVEASDSEYKPLHLNKFYKFEMLLAYLDFYINGYTQNDIQTMSVTKIPDDQFSAIKDLVKGKMPKATVRRKNMVSKGAKIPYIHIEGGKDSPSYSIGMTTDGKYRLFKIDKEVGAWEGVATANTWDNLYDILGQTLSGNPPKAENNGNASILNHEQLEWLQTFMKVHKPGVLIKTFGNGVVGGYDPSNQVYGTDNPLFVIRRSNLKNGDLILQIHQEDGGAGMQNYEFSDFDSMSAFIESNVDLMTQLLKGHGAVEADLPTTLEKLGFVYKSTQVMDTYEGSKNANSYRNSLNEEIHIFDDGSSLVWMNDANGTKIKYKLKTIAELTEFLNDPDKSHPISSTEPETSYLVKELYEQLAYLGFETDTAASTNEESVWVRSGKFDEKDYVRLNVNGSSKVEPSPLMTIGVASSSIFFFHTTAALKEYLSVKYEKNEDYHKKLLADEIQKIGFHKKEDPQAPLGYFYWREDMTVIPHEHGGKMFTNPGYNPQLSYSFFNTYDLAHSLDLWAYGDNDYQDGVASDDDDDDEGKTGDVELDKWITEVGFKYHGVDDEGETMVFFTDDGFKLKFFVKDNSARIIFPQTATQGNQKSIAFDSKQELIDYLKHFKSSQQSNPEDDKKFSKEYYHDLGDAQKAYSIRLTKEDEAEMKKMGWSFKPASETQQPSAYFAPNGYRIIFFNKSLAVNGHLPVARVYKNGTGGAPGATFVDFKDDVWNTPHEVVKYLKQNPTAVPTTADNQPEAPKPENSKGSQYCPEQEVVDLLKSKGFKDKMMVYGTTWVHPSKFSFELYEKSVVWHSSKSTKEFGIPKESQFDFLQKALDSVTPQMNDGEIDDLFTDATMSHEDKLFDKAIGMAEKSDPVHLSVNIPEQKDLLEKMSQKGFYYDPIMGIWYNEHLYQVVAPIENTGGGGGIIFKVWRISNNGVLNCTLHVYNHSLFKAVGPGGYYEKKSKKKDNQQGDSKAPQNAADIQGMEMPSAPQEKFTNAGFVYDSGLKEYVKTYANDGFMYATVKYDGSMYHVSYPHVGGGQKTHKEFSVGNPYAALNTIKKVENAEFGPIVQSEEDALKKVDANYFNAPNGWTPYQPYSPTPHPTSIKPEYLVDKEMMNLGFAWVAAAKLYKFVDPTDGSASANWQAVRFDQNGTIIYFYPDSNGNRRYYCSKHFADIEHKIEVIHSHNGPTTSTASEPNPTKPMPWSGFDYEGWAKGSEHNPNGTIGLVDEDNATMNKMGFIQQYENQAFVYTNNSEGERVYFLVDGTVKFYGKDTEKTFPSVKSAMEFLWSITDLGETPEIPADYQGDQFTEEEYVIGKMESFGFEVVGGKPPKGASSSVVKFIKKDKSFIYDVVYEPEKKLMQFYKSSRNKKGKHHSIVDQWSKSVKDAIFTFDDVFGEEEVVPADDTIVPNVIKPKSKKSKKKVTGEMPWSGHDYNYSKLAQQQGKQPKSTTIHLVPEDEETMEWLGFHHLTNNGITWYEKTGDGRYVQFYADGSANIFDKVNGVEIDSYDTVYECMKALWDEHSGFIEESIFKKFMNVWME